MDVKSYSVEVTVCENEKYNKGILTLFIDEYVFGRTRTTVDWEKTTCERGMIKVKTFLFSCDKPYVVFKYNGNESGKFILEKENMDILLEKIAGYIEHIKNEREEKLVKERKAEEERIQQEKNEKIIREEVKRNNEERLNKEKEQFERKQSEKKVRIQKEVENCKNSLDKRIYINENIKKIASCFLNNPYRVLGVSCVAIKDDANQALDKLKKLARLKALESYKSPFDITAIERPIRELSIAQNALAMLKEKTHKWFWFAESDACYAWYSGKYRIELIKDGQEFGTYDLFLANYMYAILCDSKFETSETWKRVFNFYCFICQQNSLEILKSRFTEEELENSSDEKLLSEFKEIIFAPLIQMCDTDDVIAILRLNKYIRDCNNKLLDELSRTVLGKVEYWFKCKEIDAFAYLGAFDEENITVQQQKEIREIGNMYCQKVERVFDAVLKELRGESMRYEIIKESYRKTTYQFMYMLHKCPDKSDDIFFANKTYTYCKEVDRQRIKDVFGKKNIKFIDWNIPHTSWDIKGDEYFFGKGCEVDYTQAIYWYHKAADEGNMYSQNSLGLCYQKGIGVTQSDEQAVYWYKKAYESGSPDGAYNLAECYFQGKGVKKSIDKALEMWDDADKFGHPSAGNKKKEIFVQIQEKRKLHRVKNHICHDIGFQIPIGVYIAVEVSLNKAANVYLVNVQGYQSYLEGNDFQSSGGGYITQSPYRIRIPSSNHWYVIIDNGDDDIEGISATVNVKKL